MLAHDVQEHPTVLLVEDDAVARAEIVACLAEAGCNVVQATSAGEALMTLEMRQDVEVLFADLDVPSEPTTEKLAREVHERWPAIGLVIMS